MADAGGMFGSRPVLDSLHVALIVALFATSAGWPSAERSSPRSTA
jgi:hypothetical protein